jgi:hypothetical protein
VNRSEEKTQDICPLDFPPEIYGRNLEAIEGTVQAVIETVFRDEDGILRSGVYGKTMKPFTLEDVRDRTAGVGGIMENGDFPRELKPLWLNYENAGQASGIYLIGLVEKYRVTQCENTAALARKTFQAIECLWNNAAAQNPFGRGFIPKPYAGIRDVGTVFECSIDQYNDLALGLESFYRHVATVDEKRVIEAMIRSFADWWIGRNYTTNYVGKCLVWHQLDYPHCKGFFLYLLALAYAMAPDPKYRAAFDSMMKSCACLTNMEGDSHQSAGLTVSSMRPLLLLRPELSTFWNRVIETGAEKLLLDLSLQSKWAGLPQFRMNGRAYAALYLSMAHDVLPESGYGRAVKASLEDINTRSDFYHICRGQPVCELDPRVTGDDYRDAFWAEHHAQWFGAYWTLRRLKV